MELDVDLVELVASSPRVLPFAIEDKWVLDSDVGIATVIFSVVPSDAVVANDSNGIEMVLTDIFVFVCGEEPVVVADAVTLTLPVFSVVSEV